MNVPRSSLRSFLASAKSTLQSAIINQQRVTLVIGNESADLDSITSAIVLAYFRSQPVGTTPLTNTSVNKHTPPSQYPPLYIPVVNIPRADVQIRPELLALLPHANLEPSSLITLDDLVAEPPAGLDPSGRDRLQPRLTRLVLVDHNKLAGPLGDDEDQKFSDCVRGCIDHHVDEGVVPPDTGAEPRIIEKCGSCTSLVTRFCRPVWDSLSGLSSQSHDSDSTTWDAQIARLAIASVLIDTANLADPSKTTATDRDAVTYLESKILTQPSPTTWDRTAFYDSISAAKKDLSGLSPAQILRKDYKQWTINHKNLGISSAVATLSWQIDHAKSANNFVSTMRHFARERKIDIFAIMAHSTLASGDHQRELLLWSLREENDGIVIEFEKEMETKLGLEAWDERKGLENGGDGTGLMKVWWQRKTEYSRKQVAPLIREVMKEFTKGS